MTFPQLMQENGAWAAHNFKIIAPHYGFGEEIGEITHVLLKAKQRIRGFHDPQKVEEHLKDALGDATIYLAHWCYINHVHLNYPTRFTAYHEPDRGYPLGQLYEIASKIIDARPHDPLLYYAERALQELTDFAACAGWNLERDCVTPVWTEVRKRDWVVFPQDGLTK